MASVKVAVRVRPFSKRELELNSPAIISMTGNTTQLTNTKLPSTGNESFGRERVKQFTYDYSYWSVNPEDDGYCSQQKVFDDLGEEVVQSAFSGYNACVFAYGQTGSGKTYTMMGSPDNYGLTPRVCEKLFSQMYDSETSQRTEISYMEIYNERVRDLLRDPNQPQLNLRVREHPREGPYVQDLTKHAVMNYANIEELLRQGNMNRTTALTNMNDHSSRSHAIFSIIFTQAKFADDIPSEVHSKIHLVDLAGSERADTAGTSGERLKEGGNINKSLVTLGSVISTLAEISNRSSRSSLRRSIFIPYRDSVLTWLLKDSLGGNSKTIMIATVSPAECHYAETLSTLRYAKRAKKIVNKPIVNEDPNVQLIRELRAENARLRAMLGETGMQDALTPLKQFVETRELLTRNEEKVQELIDEWADKWQETAHILKENRSLGLRREGSAIVLDSELPYLFGIDDNVLNTGMILYHLKEGDTTVGRDDAQVMPDIVLVGRGIEASHCIIRYENAKVSLVPVGDALCYVNNVAVHEPTKLTQGAIIRLGRNNMFRFNDPHEAARLRQEVKQMGESTLGTDMHWRWSCVSMTDSAVGSDFGDFIDNDRLDEKRKQLEQLEEMNERDSSDNRQQSQQQNYNETDEPRSLFARGVEEERMEQYRHRVDTEQRRLKQTSDELDASRQCQNRVSTSYDDDGDERSRLNAIHQQQMMEWIELEQERKHQLTLRQQDQLSSEQHLARVEKLRQIERQTWAVELADLRNMVEDEVKVMKNWTELCKPTGADVGSGGQAMRSARPHSRSSCHSDDDSYLDLESLQLKLDFDLSDSAHFGQGSSGLHDSSFISALQNTKGTLMDREQAAKPVYYQVTQQVCDIHSNVCELLQQKYGNVLTFDLNPLCDIKSQLSKVKEQFDQMKELVPYNTCQSPNASNIGVNVVELTRRLSLVEQFLQIETLLADVDASLSSGCYSDVIDKLDIIQLILLSVNAELDLESGIVKILRTELRIARERLLYELGEQWNRMVHWTLPVDHRRQHKNCQSASLDVASSVTDRLSLGQVVMAMSRTNMIMFRLKTFADRVMTYLIEPVITDNTSQLQTIDEPSRSIICVIINPTSGLVHCPTMPSDAFRNVEQIFTFLHTAFRGIYICCDNDSEKLVPLLLKIGRLLSKQLFDRLYESCILPVAPHSGDSNKSWVSFGNLVADTERFQSVLVNLGVLPSADTSQYDDINESLLDRLNNANARFASLKSQELLHVAHKLMKDELVDSVHVSSDYPIGKPPAQFDGCCYEDVDQFVRACREQAAMSGLKLPSCQISKSVCNLVALAYETLKEALSSSNEAAIQLCNSTYCMLQLYDDLVPTYHQDKVVSLPLFAALHHNNCMFIAHHVIVIDKAYRQKLSSEVDEMTPPPGDDCDENEPKLAELVPKMRRVGNDSFNAYIDGKKLQLHKLITEANDLACIADDNAVNAMKLVQSLFHHFHHLNAIWIDILPTNVYLRSLGSLLEMAMGDMIEVVLAIEEYSVDDCSCLQRVLDYVSSSAVDLFRSTTTTTTNDYDNPSPRPELTVHEVAPSWMRIRELSMLFGSNLQQVDDRWADGKGPLALYFTADDVVKYIMAAFEKTSRRDALVVRLRKHHNKTCAI